MTIAEQDEIHLTSRADGTYIFYRLNGMTTGEKAVPEAFRRECSERSETAKGRLHDVDVFSV